MFIYTLNPNPGRGVSNFSPPCWFSLNSEKVKAIALAFFILWQHFIRDIRAKFGIPNSPQSLDIGQNSDGCISDFRIPGQSLMKENCHNSRISDNIGRKLWPVTRLDKTKKKKKKNTIKNVWILRHVNKFWRPEHFYNLWPIWSNPEAGFRTHSL